MSKFSAPTIEIALNFFQQKKHQTRVIPVVSLTDVKQALPLAEALLAGGIDAIEITLRHPSAMAAIDVIARANLPMCLLAGTVLSVAQLRAVIDAGAQGALSPGLDLSVIQAAIDQQFSFIPGVMTPSEAMTAYRAGCRSLKFFPAVQAGGVGTLNAIGAVLPELSFCPTGGISLETAPTFLKLPNIAVVGGSWLTPKTLLEAGDWRAITALAKTASDATNVN